jgi:hypothetical protein
MRRVPSLLVLAAVLVTTPVVAQRTDRASRHGEDKPTTEAKHDSDTAAPDPEAAVASAVEEAQPKQGSVATTNGRRIEYTVTPGTLTMVRHDGAKEFSVH